MNDGFALEQQNLAEMHINNDAGYHSTRTYRAAKKRQEFHIKKFEEIWPEISTIFHAKGVITLVPYQKA